jgi:alcohol dehydrogenase (cytochrome c)
VCGSSFDDHEGTKGTKLETMKSLHAAVLILAATLGVARCQSAEKPNADLAQQGQWLTYSGDYSGRRHSPLAQITRSNVSQLRPEWTFAAGEEGPLEASPLVLDATIYLTGISNTAWAIDGRSGREIWRYTRQLPGELRLCCNASNRGFAMHGDRLFMATLDAHLVALDRRTGAVLFDVVIDKPEGGYSGSAAPLVVGDKVVVGISGGEFASRGFLDAYDVQTGARRWRFWTVPLAGEQGSETWPADSSHRGGGTTWLTGTYDPTLNLLYWGTGNPTPPFDGSQRKGDNLYTNSLVALDADTGALRWHYQFTPHDTHDWDANQIPVLADLPIDGRLRKVIMLANRNGFFYVLGREKGDLLLAKPFVKTTWATEIGPDGRPVELPGQDPTETGSFTCPDDHGGTNFMSPSFDPMRRVFFVTARETCSRFFTRPSRTVQVGARTMGGHVQGIAQLRTGALRAIDPSTGSIKWDVPYRRPGWAGVLSTVTGLVFSADDRGKFMAVDADNGRELWQHEMGQNMRAAPVTYMIDGRQFVAIASYNRLTAFALPTSN